MVPRMIKKYLVLATFVLAGVCAAAQDQVPYGIHYQAVARDNYGSELVNRKISVKFTIISDDPLGNIEYQELHQDVITSRFGVFSLVIGYGVPTGLSACGELSQVEWERAPHYLKVEVKFENDFMDMGTMQFLAVPYALYAQKSLEPGPAGPKGDPGPKGEPGDPASDNQTISFDESNLSISGGNSVPMTSLLQNLSVENQADGNYLRISRGNSVKIATVESDGDPANEIQDLVYDAAKRELRLLKSNAPVIDLTELKNDADASPTNEIQDLQVSADKLTITGKTGPTEINLGVYRDNTDNQQLTYTESNNSLTISGGNSVTLGSKVAFRVKNSITDLASISSYPTMTYDAVEYNIGNALNASTGIFTAPSDGIYTFNFSYFADGTGDGREIAIYVNSVFYDKLAISIGAGSTIPVHSVTMNLSTNNTVSVVIYTGLATQTGTGTFSGFKVY